MSSFLGNETGLLKKVRESLQESMTWNNGLKVLKKHEISASLQRIIFAQVFLETGKKLHCMRKVMLEKNHGIKAAEMLKIISGP